MSNLLTVALGATANAFRNSSYRLIQKPALVQSLKEAFTTKVAGLRLLRPVEVIKTKRINYCSHRPVLDANTSVTKDVVLFKYENPRFFNVLNIFAICQFIFWNYLAQFAFTTLKDRPVDQHPGVELAWYQRINLGDNKYRNAITIFCFMIGYGVLVISWMYTLRSVRFLILRKGGKDVSFVTYGPFNKNRIMTVPLRNVSAQESREAARVQLPIKVRNRSFYYILDMRGEFRNGHLFDHTAGLKRRIE